MRGKALSVVYTNDLVSVESSIQTMERFLAEDKYQVVGFDLEYTIGHVRHIRGGRGIDHWATTVGHPGGQ